jgi:hypothetical protein
MPKSKSARRKKRARKARRSQPTKPAPNTGPPRQTDAKPTITPARSSAGKVDSKNTSR